jgi:hypothetical protein
MATHHALSLLAAAAILATAPLAHAQTRPDGTPGNPPSIATGRAVDRAQGQIPRSDGTRGNPPSTVTGRAVDRAQGRTSRPDGTRGNPPGTAAGRAVDRTLGTSTTGANPAVR